MKIAVCVKQVPDTWAEKTLSAADSTLDRAAADGVLNELDEYAVEEALQVAEAHGCELTVVSTLHLRRQLGSVSAPPGNHTPTIARTNLATSPRPSRSG